MVIVIYAAIPKAYSHQTLLPPPQFSTKSNYSPTQYKQYIIHIYHVYIA